MRWQLTLLMLIMALFFAACSSGGDEAGLSDADKQEVRVNITLTIGGATGTTRATAIAPDDNPDIDIEGGLPYEDYIAPNDIQLLVYDQDDKFVEQMNVLWLKSDYEGSTAATEEYRCYVHGSLENITKQDIDNGTKFHFVALCNVDGMLKANSGYDKSTLGSLINSLSYSGYNKDYTAKLMAGEANIDQETRIPMWGICTTGLTIGELTDIEIPVLRTVAKVRVRLSDALTAYTLEGITLNVANTGGTMAAQTLNGVTQAYASSTVGGNRQYTTAWNTDALTPIKFASHYTGGTTDGSGQGLPFVEHEENGDMFWVIYMPEYNNVTDNINGWTETGGQSPAFMTLTIKNKFDKLVKYNGNLPVLHFGDYSSGTNPTAPQWDIIRNEIYEYVITGIEGADGLQTELRVVKWFKYTHPGVVM